MQFSLEAKNVQVANNFSLSIFALLFDIFANKKPLTCIIHSTASIICNLPIISLYISVAEITSLVMIN